MTSQRQFDIWGPWTGTALPRNPPLPYAIQRRRNRAWCLFLVAAALISIGCGLAGLANS